MKKQTMKRVEFFTFDANPWKKNHTAIKVQGYSAGRWFAMHKPERPNNRWYLVHVGSGLEAGGFKRRDAALFFALELEKRPINWNTAHPQEADIAKGMKYARRYLRYLEGTQDDGSLTYKQWLKKEELTDETRRSNRKGRKRKQRRVVRADI